MNDPMRLGVGLLVLDPEAVAALDCATLPPDGPTALMPVPLDPRVDGDEDPDTPEPAATTAATPEEDGSLIRGRSSLFPVAAAAATSAALVGFTPPLATEERPKAGPAPEVEERPNAGAPDPIPPPPLAVDRPNAEPPPTPPPGLRPRSLPAPLLVLEGPFEAEDAG